jgi:hypothetical protein
MPKYGFTDDEPIRPPPDRNPAPGLEGVPRADMTEMENAVPKLVDTALRGPVVLNRHGREAFVLLPLDIWRQVWGAIPRPPVIPGTPAE